MVAFRIRLSPSPVESKMNYKGSLKGKLQNDYNFLM